MTSDPIFTGIAARLHPLDTTLDEVRLAAHSLYDRTHDFFALHTMTGCHAARLVLGELNDDRTRQRMAASTAVAVLAAWVVVGAPSFDPSPAPVPLAPDPGGWSRACAEAVGSDDEHVIKLVYTAMSEAEAHGDDTYLPTVSGTLLRERTASRTFTGLG